MEDLLYNGDLRNLSKEELEHLKELTKKSTFLKKSWQVVKMYTVQQYAYILPCLNFIDGDPEVVLKPKKDGGSFMKLVIPIKGSPEPLEFDLPYSRKYAVGNVLDVDTLHICIEEFLGQEHLCAIGEVL